MCVAESSGSGSIWLPARSVVLASSNTGSFEKTQGKCDLFSGAKIQQRLMLPRQSQTLMCQNFPPHFGLCLRALRMVKSFAKPGKDVSWEIMERWSDMKLKPEWMMTMSLCLNSIVKLLCDCLHFWRGALVACPESVHRQTSWSVDPSGWRSYAMCKARTLFSDLSQHPTRSC